MTGCGHPYKMQSPAELARPENPTPKWPVPQDLIELQPSYAQVTITTHGLYNTHRLVVIQSERVILILKGLFV